MNSISPGEVGGIFAGAVVALATIGKGLAWLLNWQQARTDATSRRLKEWEASLDQREKEQRTEREQRLRNIETCLVAVAQALHEVTAELRTHAPGSDALRRAEQVLREAYGPVFDIPRDMEVLARGLDQRSAQP